MTTPEASIYKNHYVDNATVEGVSIGEAIKYFCKTNGLIVNFTEDQILIDLENNSDSISTRNVLRSYPYIKNPVKSLSHKPLIVSNNSTEKIFMVESDGYIFKDISELRLYLNNKNISSDKCILFISATKNDDRFENLIISELFKITKNKKIDFYVKPCLSRKTDYIYIKYSSQSRVSLGSDPVKSDSSSLKK